MSQKTNLNISPYFDDFDAQNNFYRVLFKPGYPVQARELSTIQSILQNQIESFGSSIFKDGSVVIPGSVFYDSLYYSVKINSEHLGIPVSLYIDQLINKKIKGSVSGVSATIINYSIPPSEGVENVTLYVKYSTSGESLESVQFSNNEDLIVSESVTYGNTTINSNNTIATTLDFNSTATGSLVGVTDGVYFIRGLFVNVSESKVILDPYSNSTSYRVGLSIFEEIVSSNEDKSLNDNAAGFSNFAAPGADRLKISTILTKKAIDDFDDKNFVELIKIVDGEVKKLRDKSNYSIIKDYFAKRTYEESGNYSLIPFNLKIQNSLSDRISNNGIYNFNQKTSEGNTPSDDLMCINVSPTKSYVYGYDIDISENTILDVEKPRDTAEEPSSFVPFEMGNLLRINNVYGTPFIGINTSTNIVNLQNQRRSSSTSAGTGTTIGQARIYSYALTDAAYSNESSQWDLHLFDLQIYTSLVLNETLNSSQCPKSSYIQGVSSGASGYTTENASSSTLTLTQISGGFITGEQILINGTDLYSRNIKSVKKYNAQDIKSIYQDTTAISSGQIPTDFVADTVLYKKVSQGFSIVDQLSITSLNVTSGIVTCSGKSFLGIRSDTIISYQRSNKSVPTYNRVLSVSTDGSSMTIGQGTTVSSISDGGIPSTLSTTFSIVEPLVRNQEKSSLYTPLNNTNVSTVDLSRANLTISSQVRGRSTSATGTLTITNSDITGITSVFFEAYDEERYSISYSNGTIETLTSDQVVVNANGTQVIFSGLLSSQSNVTVNVTLNKTFIKNKTKNFVRSKKFLVNKTNSGVSTSITGLTYNQFYGLRIEDKEISLNVPDVVNVVAVYESYDSSQPVLDSLTFSAGLNLDTESILGEKISGDSSGAIAQVAGRSSNSIEFIYLNDKKFVVGELINFLESNIKSYLQEITLGSYLNITNRYVLDKGQKNEYYDYSKIVRKSEFSAPNRKLLVIFDSYEIPSNDTGDLYTVNSYSEERFNRDIPVLTYYSGNTSNQIRSTDVIDFRPRVSEFTSTSSSPFYYENKTFGTSSSLTPNYVVTPGESSLLSYSYYLPRIDKVVLNKLGELSVIKGVSSLNPKEPTNVEEAMDVATIELPAYLYDSQINGVKITLVDNRRYTMRDISKIDNRVKNLESTTSLSLLELDTKSLQIQDADGLGRFKTGFFVDDFKDDNLLEKNNKDVQCSVDTGKRNLLPMNHLWSIKPLLALDPSINPETADYSLDLPLLDKNVKKTGDLVTLNYSEKQWIEQPFASRVENVNPFSVIEYKGAMTLNPSVDEWVRNVYINRYRTVITNRGDREYDYVEDVKTTLTVEPYARERNVEFRAGSLRPLTRHYPFIDNSSSITIVPKLIEVNMISGIFEPGEDVFTTTFVGRCTTPNHKFGAYNNPQRVYNSNPYDTTQILSRSYSATSTVVNIDTTALADESLGDYGGYVSIGQQIIGETSGAVARITNVRLVSDTYGQILGCFYIPDPNNSEVPVAFKISTGESTFKLNSSPDNSEDLPGSDILASDASSVYTASGQVITTEQSIVQIRNPPPPPPPAPRRRRRRGKDPLAQSFTVDETGAFLTSVDLFFARKDLAENVFVEVRTVELGTPTDQLVQDYARAILEPGDINLSTDASIPTNVKFPSPVYLQPNTEYAIVILSPTSNNNEVWIARMGEQTINTQDFPDVESVVVTTQYIGGSLFKSQNGTIWTASQYEDLKFKLYKSNFTSTTGDVVYYNPNLENNDLNLPSLVENAVKTFPRKLKVGIVTTTNLSSTLTVGTVVGAGGSTPYGYIERVGSEVSSLSIANVGIGYSNGTFTSVPLYSITGNGSGLTATVVISGGVVSSVTTSLTGNGYSVGDIVGVTTNSIGKGSGSQISVNAINGIDTLYLTNVQGENFYNNPTTTLNYYNGTTWVGLANTFTTSSTLIGDLYSGNVIEVTQYNHGMHSDTNKVRIVGVSPDTIPTNLTSTVNIDSSTLTIVSGATFNTFEGISTSTGYILIDEEIIEYDNVSGGTLSISARGVNDTPITSHVSSTPVYKYELNKVSLTRINTEHTLSNNSTLKRLRDFDTYYIEFDRDTRSNGNTQLSFGDEKIIGGNNISATQNIQFNSIIPEFSVITPGKSTKVSAQIRTVSATSAGGSEESFLDLGFEPVELNKINYLSTSRMICSRVNEINNLPSLPNSKSFTTKITLSSDDSNLSPVLDTQNGFLILNRNRINNPITDYVSDGRVNLVSGDPHTSIYISNRINLKQPATSLKVLLGAYRPEQTDFRVLYQIFKTGSGEVEPAFELFPGYDNLKDTDGDGYGDFVINSNLNNGKPDAYIQPSRIDEFLEYQYTIDNLDPFTSYAIKIVMTSTNEAKIPKFKDLRTLALA